MLRKNRFPSDFSRKLKSLFLYLYGIKKTLIRAKVVPIDFFFAKLRPIRKKICEKITKEASFKHAIFRMDERKLARAVN